jgi:hypothetical protein
MQKLTEYQADEQLRKGNIEHPVLTKLLKTPQLNVESLLGYVKLAAPGHYKVFIKLRGVRNRVIRLDNTEVFVEKRTQKEIKSMNFSGVQCRKIPLDELLHTILPHVLPNLLKILSLSNNI